MNIPVRGWIVRYKDGTVVTEADYQWKEISKKDIESLRLKWNSKLWDISGKKNYFEFKSASIAPGEQSPLIHSRVIGYYDEDGNKIMYRVNEFTGQMKMEIKESDKRVI
jgi:hypothetical protein